MAEEGAFEAAEGAVHSHPWLIGGAIGAAVLVLYLISHKSTPAVQQFSYSSGPSAASVQAQGAEQVAATQASAASSIAATQAAANTSIAAGYFNYLSNNSASNAKIALGTAGYAATTAQTVAADALASNVAKDTAATNQAAIASQTTITHDQYAAQTLQQQLAYGAAAGAGVANGTQAPAAGAANFVSSLYHSVLGRAPENAGLTYWTNLITSGQLTTSQVQTDIQNSAEHITDLTGVSH